MLATMGNMPRIWKNTHTSVNTFQSHTKQSLILILSLNRLSSYDEGSSNKSPGCLEPGLLCIILFLIRGHCLGICICFVPGLCVGASNEEQGGRQQQTRGHEGSDCRSNRGNP